MAARPKRRKREDSTEYVRVVGALAYVTLTNGATAVIDAEDAPLIGGMLWFLDSDGYAKSSITANNKITLHRALICPPDGFQVDHIDGDRLNNCRSNLRICTNCENQRNQRPRKTGRLGPVTCSYKGVQARRGKYVARIRFDGRQRTIGTFATAREAAKAYDVAARESFGEFAKVNFK